MRKHTEIQKRHKASLNMDIHGVHLTLKTELGM